MKYTKQLLVAAIAAGMTLSSLADVSLTSGTEKDRGSTYPRGLSGLTYLGGNKYYSVCDNGNEIGLYPCTISLSADGLSVSSFSTVATNQAVRLPSTSDLEACAYDPATGNIWVADEAGATIKEYTTNGVVVQTLSYPAILKNKRHDTNRGFESLTISGDGLTMWTCTEEGLTIDSDISAQGSGTLIRLVKFTRRTVNDKFELAAMYPYLTDGWHNPYGLEASGAAHGSGSGRRGIAALTALPDGSLLVLERECSSDTAGNGFWAKLGAEFWYSIYRVSDFSSATDVKGSEYDVGLNSVPAVRVVKTRVIDDFVNYICNYEGMCLGPRLSNGKSTILLVTDSGDGNTSSSVWPFVLSGLNVRTLDFEEPAGYTASIKGSNYRYLDGAQITVALSKSASDAEAVAAGKWSVANQSPESGSGYVASFTVEGDGTFKWHLANAAASSIMGSDTFEAYAVKTQGNTIPQWSGDDSEVVEATYTPSAGYPIEREAHTKVLSVDGEVTRTYTQTNANQTMDMMLAVRRAPSEEIVTATPMDSDTKVAVACDKDGYICIKCKMAVDGTNGWVRLSNVQYNNDAWVRVTLSFDFTSNGSGKAYVNVKLDGVECSTAYGHVSPTDSTANGSWHELMTAGANQSISSLSLSGICKVDDVILSVEAPFDDDEVAEIESILGDKAAAMAADITAYVNGLGCGQNAVESITAPMALSYLFNANTILDTPASDILKIKALEQVGDDWRITVSANLNAEDIAAGATVDLNRIRGALKVKATSELDIDFGTVSADKFNMVQSETDPNDVVITVSDENAKFLKATVEP